MEEGGECGEGGIFGAVKMHYIANEKVFLEIPGAQYFQATRLLTAAFSFNV